MCQPRGHQRSHGFCGCGCGSFPRRFVSGKEERERLERYKDQLKKELEGVDERLEELKKD